MIGGSGGRAAVMGAMPHAADTDSEVLEFVKSLMEHGRVDLGKKKQAATRMVATGRMGTATHAIKSVGGRSVLSRVCFQCGGCH